MKRQLLLTVGILFVISMQAVAPQVKAAVSTATAIPTPVPGVSVSPNPSVVGHPIVFKAPSDPGKTIQLSIQNFLGKEVFTTCFNRATGSSGYVWRLQDRSGNPVPIGVYNYILRFKLQGQVLKVEGKVAVR